MGEPAVLKTEVIHRLSQTKGKPQHLHHRHVRCQIADTADAESIDAFKTIHLSDELNTLTTVQPQYSNLINQRSQIKESDSTPLLIPSRREVHKELSMLERFVNYRVHHKHESFTELVTLLNGPVIEIMAIAKARNTVKENNEEN